MRNNKEINIAEYDPTIELKNEWTVLMSREKGREIFNKIENRISDDTNLILLDFAMVTAVDKSFFDAFLIPIYKKFKNKFIVGINIDKQIVLEDIYKKGINSTFKEWDVIFFVITNNGEPYLLGSKYSLSNDILSLTLNELKLTKEQIAVQLDKDLNYVVKCLNYLKSLGIIDEQKTSRNYVYYSIKYVEIIKGKIGKTVIKIIDDLVDESITEEGHFELPSGIHTDKFFHLSPILKKPRMVRMIGSHFASVMGSTEPDFILTTETPNNIVLAYRFGQHVSKEDTKIIYARKKNADLELYNDFEIKKSERGIIVVDTVFTGYIANLLIKLVLRNGGRVIGICSVLDLSNGTINFSPYKYYALIQREVNAYRPEECPLCIKNIPTNKLKIIPEG